MLALITANDLNLKYACPIDTAHNVSPPLSTFSNWIHAIRNDNIAKL